MDSEDIRTLGEQAYQYQKQTLPSSERLIEHLGLISNKNFMEQLNKKINMIVWNLNIIFDSLLNYYSFSLFLVKIDHFHQNGCNSSLLNTINISHFFIFLSFSATAKDSKPQSRSRNSFSLLDDGNPSLERKKLIIHVKIKPSNCLLVS